MAFAGLMLQTQTAVAQDRLAIVIGNGAYADTPLAKPTSNGISVSRSLLGLGIDVLRLENVNASDRQLGVRTADTVILYFSGKIALVDEKTALLSVDQNVDDAPAGWPLEEVVLAYQNAGAKRVLVFLDTCHTELDAEANQLAAPLDMPDVFVAQAAPPNSACPLLNDSVPDFTNQLLAALLSQDMPLSEALGADDTIWASSTLTQPYIFRKADAQIKRLSAEDHKMLNRLSKEDRERMLALWRQAGIIDGMTPNTAQSSVKTAVTVVQNETIVLIAPVKPVSITATITPAVTVTPVSNVNPARNGPIVQSGIQIFTAAATPARQSQPRAAGLPKPSIIVGDILPTNASFDPAEAEGTVSGTEMSSFTYEARRQIRADNPELFEQLLTSGAFDPLPSVLPAAIQAELARMRCYSSTVDGVWGRGSRAAVDRYFQQVGTAAILREPVVELFRKMVRKDDVVCPVVVQATTRGTAQRPRATQPTAPASTGRTLNPNIANGGIFR